MHISTKIVENPLVENYPGHGRISFSGAQDSNANIFLDNFFNIKPWNLGVLASLARLLAVSCKCGCIYIDGDNLYFSGNLANNGNQYYTDKHADPILKKLIEIIGNLTSNQQQVNNIKILKEELVPLFIEKIVENTIVYNKKHRLAVKDTAQKLLNTDNEKVISELAIMVTHHILLESVPFPPTERRKKSKPSPLELSTFYVIRKDLDTYIKNSQHTRNNFHKYMGFLACYLQDLFNFLRIVDYCNNEQWDQLKQELSTEENAKGKSLGKELTEEKLEKITNNEVENYKFLVSFFRAGRPVKIVRQIKKSSPLDNKGDEEVKLSHFHCEGRMFEHIITSNTGQLNKSSWKIFMEAAQQKRIVISKPCCLYCHNFLISTAIAMNDNYQWQRKELLPVGSGREEELKKLLAEFLKFNEKSDSSMITAFFGNSARIFEWISPSVLTGENEEDQIITTIRENFKTLGDFWKKVSGVLHLVNENSEALYYQILYNPPQKDYAEYGHLQEPE